MGVPIIFLIIAPLAGIIALQLTPPFSSAAVILSLVFSACGLGNAGSDFRCCAASIVVGADKRLQVFLDVCGACRRLRGSQGFAAILNTSKIRFDLTIGRNLRRGRLPFLF